MNRAPRRNQFKGGGEDTYQQKVAVRSKKVEDKHHIEQVPGHGGLDVGAWVKYPGHGHTELHIHHIPHKEEKIVKEEKYQPARRPYQQLHHHGNHHLYSGAINCGGNIAHVWGKHNGQAEDQSYPHLGGHIAPVEYRVKGKDTGHPAKNQDIDSQITYLQHSVRPLQRSDELK